MIDKSLRDETGPQIAPGDERRRSQRVRIRIRVTLHFVAQGKHTSVVAHTISVNDQGALLHSTRNLPAGTQLEIENSRTGQRLPCRITRHSQEISDGFQIPVEFAEPN